uniref:Uncharacterized protein LOC116939550 n=1 Tax=Petromyzon marinus TaxID=7757 RepID=A0AAJ7SRN1_PETMA|nr:uncharacterized protein LOC116939550 [Petromyzon marinus]
MYLICAQSWQQQQHQHHHHHHQHHQSSSGAALPRWRRSDDDDEYEAEEEEEDDDVDEEDEEVGGGRVGTNQRRETERRQQQQQRARRQGPSRSARNPAGPARPVRMITVLTKKLRAHTIDEVQPLQLKVTHSSSEEEEDDSEDENQELAQIDRERRRLGEEVTPLALSRQQNSRETPPLPGPRPMARADSRLERPSSEEELESIITARERMAAAAPLSSVPGCAVLPIGGAGAVAAVVVAPAAAAAAAGGGGGGGGGGTIGFVAAMPEKRKWCQVGAGRACQPERASSSDEEVKDLCTSKAFRPIQQNGQDCASPLLFSASPPRCLQPVVWSPRGARLTLSALDQASPCKRHKQALAEQHTRRPSLDFEKMQQRMLLKKHCASRTRLVKIRSVSTGPRYICDPSVFAFRSLSTLNPMAPMTPVEEPSCA